MHYLAEFYRARRGPDLDVVAAAARAAAERTSGDIREVRLLTAIYAHEDESCFMLYLADSADLVTAAGELAGLAFDRVVEVTIANLACVT